jgi:hypothetical protein
VGINQALSTPLFTFPDAVVPRHPDFVFLGAANSYGHGSADYVGRFKQDVAALDRFAYLLWEYDEALELAFATNKAWAKRVQKARARAIEKGMKVVISPRATLAGCALLAKGLKMDRVDALVLRKGMSDDQWSSLEMGA